MKWQIQRDPQLGNVVRQPGGGACKVLRYDARTGMWREDAVLQFLFAMCMRLMK